MASSFFAILDDIAALMDDVAVASKVATQKTAGILGDDLAVNAEKATGFLETRELPVLWAITKGSFVNKLIIIPIVFGLNALLPIAIKIILVLGGFYLAFEGVEKIVHYLFHKKHHDAKEVYKEEVGDTAEVAEKKKVKSAISTDFILSLEIVIIALSTVIEKTWQVQLLTVSVVAVIATVGVYGIVALIVRMDDTGYKLIRKSKNGGFMKTVGTILVKSLPIVIRSLAVIGTIALILVAGGIFVHNIAFLHHLTESIPSMLVEVGSGILGGLLVLLLVTLFSKIKALFKA